MKTRSLVSGALALGISAILLTGCESDNGVERASGSRAAPARYRQPADASPANYRDEATPSGLSGFDKYDQPGQLPPNSGGTNAGRVGVDPDRARR